MIVAEIVCWDLVIILEDKRLPYGFENRTKGNGLTYIDKYRTAALSLCQRSRGEPVGSK